MMPVDMPAPPAAGDARPLRLRMAGLHLRMGSLALARAELEALAGRGALDEAALVDLAEARWRTGDLAGAGEAADALLAAGREDPLALVIAAEAVAAAGRPGEARRLAARALGAVAGPLDPLFAGMPRSLIWPDEAIEPGEAAGRVDGGAHAGMHAGQLALASGATRLPVDPGPGPASTAAAEAFAGGRAALSRGDTASAALRLAVALRLDPGFAPGVLDAVGEEPEDPSLTLVVGDALRLLGREADAIAAFERVRALDGA